MPKITNKCRNVGTYDPKRFANKIRIVRIGDPEYLSSIQEWTAGDSFKSDNSEIGSDAHSKSSESSGQSKILTNKRKNCSKHSPNKSKSSAKLNSRFTSSLFVESSDTNCDNSSENSHTFTSKAQNPVIQESISDASSPMKSMPPMSQIEPSSSPIRSNRFGNQLSQRKESVNQLIRKSFINFFDQTIVDFSKRVRKSELKKVDTTLRSRTLQILKNMSQMRLEFCHRSSLQLRDNNIPLALKLVDIQTEFGISFLESIVIPPEIEGFDENSSVVLLLKEEIVKKFDPNSKYRINVYKRWTQKQMESKTYIFNAFNIEFIEDNDSSDENLNQESDYVIVYQNDRP